MPTLEESRERFLESIWDSLQSAKKVGKDLVNLSEAYTRLGSLNGWRGILDLDNHAFKFFVECQNDLLTSIALMHVGSRRVANATIRHSLESFGNYIYYRDHPIEYRMWLDHKHRLDFSAVRAYIGAHPDINSAGLPDEVLSRWLGAIKREYSETSRAVHGSSEGFLMTSQTPIPSIFSRPDEGSTGKWYKRFDEATKFMLRVLVVMHRDDLEGTKRRSLRRALAHGLGPEANEFKRFNIRIPSP